MKKSSDVPDELTVAPIETKEDDPGVNLIANQRRFQKSVTEGIIWGLAGSDTWPKLEE